MQERSVNKLSLPLNTTPTANAVLKDPNTPSAPRYNMSQMVKDSFLDLERHRQLLEDSLEKLRKSLRHWQTWEAEYEGLKEEILASKPTPNPQQLLAICHGYEGELVTRKEVEELLGVTAVRSTAQVVNMLDRRIDYVEQNVRTIEKQIETGENRLAAATVISTPDVRNEEGLPLTEIIEELDEEGNVISSHTSTPGSAKPQLLEVLQKAGVKDLPIPSTSSTLPSSMEVVDQPKPALPSTTKDTKKGVKFAEDTKSGPEVEMSQTARRLEDVMKLAKLQEAAPSEPPVIPTDESLEDAALRREMLQYGMSEVGAVVAELNLEDGSDWTDDGYDQDEISTMDDEDEFGRSTGHVVDEELRQRMIELEQKLGVRMMENIGKKASDYEIVKEGIGRVTINNREENVVPQDGSEENSQDDPTSQPASTSAKKSVRFSEDLDISSAPKLPPSPAPALNMPKLLAPVTDIVERTVPVQADGPIPQKKTSRFKSARSSSSGNLNGPLATSSNSQTISNLPLHPAKPISPKPFSTPIPFSPAIDQDRTVPTGPEGKTLAATVVERDIPPNTTIAEPDELNPQLLHQEAATEYHKMRNRMIYKQGGFVKEKDGEIVPFTEEEGGPKKMSRFKAARLARAP
jgi:unconventional prefoldin RPB5 interactor 1